MHDRRRNICIINHEYNGGRDMHSQKDRYRQYSRYAGTQSDHNPLKKKFYQKVSFWILLAAVLLLAAGGILFALDRTGQLDLKHMASQLTGAEGSAGSESELHSDGLESIGDMQTEAVSEEPETELIFNPHSVPSTHPDNLIEYTELELNGQMISQADLKPWYDMYFGAPQKYTDVDGVVTFRGNNWRNNPTYGTAQTDWNMISSVWNAQTGGLTYGNASWTGSGWTGQPLIEKWPKDVRQHMNMYDSAKAKDELVEVIYACMDGYVYFYDLETGEATRDKLYLGWTFKGSGALDPRGYPILYVGAGYDSNEGTSHVFVVNLLDCSVMYEFGALDPFSLRGNLSYFDSSALVDAASDTLIYPGENGIIYLIHLNTQYDPAAGTLSINPDNILKWRYYGKRTSAAQYWLGMEDSAAIYQGYLFIADNGGNLMCLNLNTMELVWVQDTLDDSNSTPVLSEENGHLYLYVSTSFRLGWRSNTSATVPVWKIDAETGEIVWQTDYECYTEDGVSGGVQSTIAVGDHDLDDYIYVTVARTGQAYDGVLACLDKKTGERVWEHTSYYAWSSPTCVYNDKGEGKVIYADCSGQMYLMNGHTGEVLNQFTLSDGAVEASPAVYNDYVVIGTRACKIWGLQLS